MNVSGRYPSWRAPWLVIDSAVPLAAKLPASVFLLRGRKPRACFSSLPNSPSISWEVYCWWSCFCFWDEKHGLSRFWCWFTVQSSQRFPNSDPRRLYGFCVSKSKRLTSCPLKTYLPSTGLWRILKSSRQGWALLDALSLPNVPLSSEK